MNDRVLIVLPDYLEDALYCLPVAQTYLMFGKWKLARESDVTVVCKKSFEFLVRPVFPQAGVLASLVDGQLDEFDVVLTFDRERAYRLGSPTKKTAIEAYGILCGAAPEFRLPTVAQALAMDDTKIALLQRSFEDYRGTDYVYPFKENMATFERVFQGATLVEITGDMPIDVAHYEISSAAFCLGVVGGFTLMAAAMMKPLLEIYPEKSLMCREWGAKWSAPFYRVIPGELAQVPADFLAATMDKFIGDIMKERGKVWRSMTHRVSTPLAGVGSIPTVPSR